MLLLGVFSVCKNVFANDSTIWDKASFTADSLKLELKKKPHTEKELFSIYSDIVGAYSGFAQDSVVVYAPKAIEYARKFKEHAIEMNLSRTMGVAYTFKAEYDTAIAIFKSLIEIDIKRGDKRSAAETLSLIAFTYAKEGKYNTAIDYYLEILKISENEGWTEDCVRALTNLSEINRKLSNTQTALQYLKQAEEESNKLSEDRYNWRIAHIYNEYAYNYIEEGDPDKAIVYLQKADSVNMGIVNKCYTKSLLATAYLQRKDYDQALMYAKESYRQADLIKDKNLYINARKCLSDVYMAQKNYVAAEAEALKAWQTDSTDLDESRIIAENIALANIYMHNMEKAAYYFKRYSELNKLYSEKSFHTTVSDLAVKYETDKKEFRITSLEKEKQLYTWLGVAGILFAVALGFVLWLNLRNAKKEKQLIATRSVMDGEMRERTRLARDLHDRLSGNLSAVKIELNDTVSLSNVNNKLDGCIEEVRRVAHNLMPVSLRYGIKTALEDFATQFPFVHFHFFGQDNRFEERAEFVLYCCANELVNNSLKHSGAKNINLQLVQDKKHITLTVQDDGKGYDEKSIKKGLGLKNIYDRVTSYNGKIDVVSLPGKGTETTIELKIK